MNPDTSGKLSNTKACRSRRLVESGDHVVLDEHAFVGSETQRGIVVVA